MGQHISSKCCHDMFTNDSIDSEDEDETAQLIDTNMDTKNVTKLPSDKPIKQNKFSRSTSSENVNLKIEVDDNSDNNDNNNLYAMDAKTMELLMQMEDTFTPRSPAENQSEQNEMTYTYDNIAYNMNENENEKEKEKEKEEEEIRESNKRLTEMRNLSNPVDIEIAISTHYATDAESQSELSDHEQLELIDIASSSMDEMEQREIQRLKSDQTMNKKKIHLSQSNIYRQSTQTAWSSDDLADLHNEMQQQFMQLTKQASGHGILPSQLINNTKTNNNNQKVASNLFRDQSREKWKGQLLSNEKKEMRKQMLHLVQQTSNVSKTKI